MKMNLIRFSALFLSLLIVPVYLSQAQENPSPIDKEKQAKIEALHRVTDIDNLQKELEAEQNLLPKYYPEATADSIILLISTENVTQDSFGDIKILGELQNVGNADVSFVKITYTFKDASDDVLDTEYTYVYGSSKNTDTVVTDTILSPGEVGSFSLYTNVPNDLVTSMYYTISYENYDTYQMKSEIVLHGNIVKQPDYFGYLELLGELKNLRGAIGYFVKFVATVKNVKGQVIDVGYSYINGSTVELASGIITDTALSPIEIASFKVSTIAMYSNTGETSYKINWDEGDVADTQPFSNSGDDQRVKPGQNVSLDGTGSYDPNGATLSYLWTQLSGPIVSLSNLQSATPTFTAPSVPTTLIFELSVTNEVGVSSKDSITIFVANDTILPSLLLLLD